MNWADSVKRLIDLTGALVAVVLLSPVMALAALAILLETGPPVLFRQTRVGRHDEPFTLFKLRTMTQGADDSEQREFDRRELAGELSELQVYALATDNRITRVGRLLRIYSVDELPQFFNVIRGDMSLVGPRPMLEYHHELFPSKYSARQDVRPGLTGLWQTSGRKAVDMNRMLELDLQYVEQRSLWLDLRILVRTVPAVLRGEGAS
jgi:lipopolysaccharide/colanic/teichoic acid biosynthesis glycosyltransferase